MPHVNELHEKYKDDGLVVIGVCNTRGAEKIASSVREWGIEYPVAADIEDGTLHAYHADSFPDYYLIDRSGRVRIADCANARIEEAIKLLLAEKGSE